MTITVPPSPNTPMQLQDGTINPVWDQWFNYLQANIANTGGPVLAVNGGGTGQGTYSDGQLLIGNSNGATLSVNTLTAGTGIGITNGHGTITITRSGTEPVSTGGTGLSNPTAHTIPIAEGSSAFNLIGPLTNGQLLIGSTGSDPVAATLTGGTGITITTGAGSTTISQTNSQIRTVTKQIFTSNGTYTPTSGMVYCIVEAVGGGGGGNKCTSTVNSVSAGAGGSGADYAKSIISAATIGASKAVTIGAAGAQGTIAPGATNPTNGGDTSLGVLVVAKGGIAASTTLAAINTGALTHSSGAAILGTVSANASTGDIVLPGGTGGTAFLLWAPAGGSGPYAVGGRGGDSFFGRGGVEALKSGSSGAVAGNNGTGYGAGGSGGASCTTASPDVNGGNGTAGIMIITEFCT